MKALFSVPDKPTIKDLRDRAMIALLLLDVIRAGELLELCVGDARLEDGYFIVRDAKGIPCAITRSLSARTCRWIGEYLAASGHAADLAGPLFRPVYNPSGSGDLRRRIAMVSLYNAILRRLEAKAGLEPGTLGLGNIRRLGFELRRKNDGKNKPDDDSDAREAGEAKE